MRPETWKGEGGGGGGGGGRGGGPSLRQPCLGRVYGSGVLGFWGFRGLGV